MGKRFMYENIEAIYDEIVMIDIRAQYAKQFNTIKLPARVRRIIKGYITKKCIKALKKHLDSMPDVDIDYIIDFAKFFNNTLHGINMNMYRLLDERICGINIYGNKCCSIDIKYDGVKYTFKFFAERHIIEITEYRTDKTDLVTRSKYYEQQNKLSDDLADIVYSNILKYVKYYLASARM